MTDPTKPNCPLNHDGPCETCPAAYNASVHCGGEPNPATKTHIENGRIIFSTQ